MGVERVARTMWQPECASVLPWPWEVANPRESRHETTCDWTWENQSVVKQRGGPDEMGVPDGPLGPRQVGARDLHQQPGLSLTSVQAGGTEVPRRLR